MKTSAAQFAQLSTPELQKELAAAERALFETRFQIGQGKEKRTHLAGQHRRKIAVLKTLIAKQPTKPTTPSA